MTYTRGHKAVMNSHSVGGNSERTKFMGQDQYGNKYYQDFDAVRTKCLMQILIKEDGWNTMIIFQSEAPTAIKSLLCIMAGLPACTMISPSQMEIASMNHSLSDLMTGILLIQGSSAIHPEKTAIMTRPLITTTTDWEDMQNLGSQAQKDNDGIALINNLWSILRINLIDNI